MEDKALHNQRYVNQKPYIVLSHDRVSIDGFWIDNWICWTLVARDYTSHITISHRLVSSVALLGNGFNGGRSSASGLRSSQVGNHLTPTSYFDHWLQLVLPSAATAARVWAKVRLCGICGGQNGTETVFLLVLRFPLPIPIPPTAAHASSMVRSCYNRPISVRHSKCSLLQLLAPGWTNFQLPPTKFSCQFSTDSRAELSGFQSLSMGDESASLSWCHAPIWRQRLHFYYSQTVASSENTASNIYSTFAFVRCLAMALVLLHVYEALA
jgi:hypothetical protein